MIPDRCMTECGRAGEGSLEILQFGMFPVDGVSL